MALPGRWCGDVGTAGSLCDCDANDSKRLNDDYIQRINQNYYSTVLTKDLEMFVERFNCPIRVVYALSYFSLGLLLRVYGAA